MADYCLLVSFLLFLVLFLTICLCYADYACFGFLFGSLHISCVLCKVIMFCSCYSFLFVPLFRVGCYVFVFCCLFVCPFCFVLVVVDNKRRENDDRNCRYYSSSNSFPWERSYLLLYQTTITILNILEELVQMQRISTFILFYFK